MEHNTVSSTHPHDFLYRVVHSELCIFMCNADTRVIMDAKIFTHTIWESSTEELTAL